MVSQPMDTYKNVKNNTKCQKIQQDAISKEEKEKLISIKNMYEKFGTLQEVATRMELTKPRVWQMMKRGHRLGLFHYVINRKHKLNQLTKSVSRDNIVNLIKKGYRVSEICSELSLRPPELNTLRDFYKIRLKSNTRLAKRERYLGKYLEFVTRLGHHPSTRELVKSKTGRSLYGNIWMYWGGINNFRKINNIDKPGFRVTEKFKQGRRKSVRGKQLGKMERLERVRDFIKSNGKVSSKDIRAALNLRISTTILYLKELVENRTIKTDGEARSRKYY